MVRKGTKTTEQFKKELHVINPYIEVIGEYLTNSTKILVKDKRCNHEWDTSDPSSLLRGSGCPECAKYRRWDNRYIDRTNEIKYNKYGSLMTIIKYNGVMDIDVQFQDGTIINNMQYGVFKRGEIVSPYDKTVYNVGYLGKGLYVPTIDGKNTIQYYTWSSMIKRCYSEKQQVKQPTYKGCSVCEEWHNFQIFAKWWDDNYYEVDGERMEVDKDILYKGNKLYSPNTCIIVPSRINNLFVKNDAIRGEYPIGVNILDNGKFRARYSDALTGKRIHLGCFYTAKQAFEAYKINKEQYIKDMADLYKDKIPRQVYESMYNWKVEITD